MDVRTKAEKEKEKGGWARTSPPCLRGTIQMNSFLHNERPFCPYKHRRTNYERNSDIGWIEFWVKSCTPKSRS